MNIKLIKMKTAGPTGLEFMGILPFKKKYQCGHRSRVSKYRLSVEGVDIVPNASAMCPECFEKWVRNNVILCARYKEPIFPGQGVALYHREDCPHADVGHEDDGMYVGCTCMDCCPCGHFSGNWDGKRVVIHPAILGTGA